MPARDHQGPACLETFAGQGGRLRQAQDPPHSLWHLPHGAPCVRTKPLTTWMPLFMQSELNAVSLRLIMKIGPPPDAIEPGFTASERVTELHGRDIHDSFGSAGKVGTVDNGSWSPGTTLGLGEKCALSSATATGYCGKRSLLRWKSVTMTEKGRIIFYVAYTSTP